MNEMTLSGQSVRHDVSLLTDDDVFLFHEGSHYRLYNKLGAHVMSADGVQGTYFAVWAPDARDVTVMGDFNYWDKHRHYLGMRGSSGIWEGFIPSVGKGTKYKFHVMSRHGDYKVDKTDPYAFYSEISPLTASIVWELNYDWGDQEWMRTRRERNALNKPISIYELHLGSWMRVPDEYNRSLTYRELAHRLSDYVKNMGFTHVEFLPIMEHPFYGSWGYQTTGYFAPTSRYGTPQDFMFLIDHLHQNGIGVILDWVPSHLPSDDHGLAFFDGSYLYEHADPRQGFHPDWKSSIFNYGRDDVRSFLMSSGLFWLDLYHADGLRVDAVASMLYLDYSREPGEWIPNKYGGRENLDAISFLRRFNEEIYEEHPDVQTVAEESTAWPSVSRPTYVGGLGFGFKWNMGWMHDTLAYFQQDPVYRRYHHHELTFSLMYAFSENFILPLSHDEVVHGKGSLVSKMPGDRWQKLANLRALYAYMWAHPGKKLLFMGGELAQEQEWSHDRSLDWHLLEQRDHAGVQALVRELNRVYREEPALWECDHDPAGFRWLEPTDAPANVLAFARYSAEGSRVLVCVCNLAPTPRGDYRLGRPAAGHWRELLNTVSPYCGGSELGDHGGAASAARPWPD